MKIYLDACCFCRPFDDLTQTRNYVESEAILALVKMATASEWVIASSEMIDIELIQISDIEKFDNVVDFYGKANDFLVITDEIKQCASEFQKHSIKTYDSIHLALAEENQYDIFLTTDDDFLRAAQKLPLHIQVKNPRVWLMEVL
jgi:predicted nucleic acid-binding protein